MTAPTTNGHTVPRAEIPASPIGPEVTESLVGDSPRVTARRHEVTRRRAEQDLDRELAALDAADIGAETRSEQERSSDRAVAERVRRAERRERRRAGLAGVRQGRRQRLRAAWDEKAEAVRDRILDPARAVGADHRRWVASTVVLFGLLIGGVAWMATTVHDGLVGTGGPLIGYLVEPMASVLLVVSLLAQHTGRQRRREVSESDRQLDRWFWCFDAGLLAASLVLNTLPWAWRYGLDPASLTGHLLAPLLVTAVVIGLHLISRQYGATITRHRPSPRETACVALLQAAYMSGEITDDTSVSAAARYLKDRWPEGIGQADTRAIVRAALGK